MFRPITQSFTSRKFFTFPITIVCLLAITLLVKGWQPRQQAAAHSLTAPQATPATAFPAVDVKAVEGMEFPDFALIGEEFCYTAVVKNVGGQIGFGPYLQLVLPPGTDLASVSLPGINSTGASSSSNVTYSLNPPPIFAGIFPGSGMLPDPLALPPLTVTGPKDGKLYIIKLPIGSLHANEPGIPIKICLKVNGDVAPDVPLQVCHNPMFQYTTATTPPAIPGTPNCQNVTPVVALLYKLSNAPTSNHKLPAPPNETATGACHPLTFELVTNIGDSKKITNPVYSDTLPPEMVLISSAAAIQASITGLVNPQVNVVGKTITVTGDSATGTFKPDGITFSDRDVVIPFQAYIQNTDPNTCATKNVLNTATLHDAQYHYVDAQSLAHDITLMQQSGSSLIEAKHVALQKYAYGPHLPDDPTVIPDEFVDYELRYQISQNIPGFLGFRIEDTLPASMNFVPASATISYGSVVNQPINANPQQLSDGSTLLTFNPPSAALAACTKAIIRYKGQVPQKYNLIDIPVLASDKITNLAKVFYAVLAGAKNCMDDTGAEVVVKPVNITKTIANDPIPPDGFKPGDVVKFHLKMEVPSGDTGFVTFTDFLPLPVFKVGTSNNTAALIAQYSINCKLGCGPVDFSQLQVESSAADNSIKFTLKPDVLSTVATATTPLVIELEFSIPVTTDPFADDLYLTNVFQSLSSNTFGDEELHLTGIAVHVRAPVMKITKGVAFSDNGGEANISPKPSATPINGNLTNADGCDIITFAITVQNTGGAPAYDVEVTDTLPTTLVPDASSITVTGGPPVVSTPAFIGQKLTVKYQPSFAVGQTSVIKFKAKVIANISPCQTIFNTAGVVWASLTGATKFDMQNDSATVSIAKPIITKTILDPPLPYKLPIGGKVKYQVKIQIPESSLLSVTIADMLGSGLAITNSSVAAVPDAGITILGSTNGTISATGDMLTFGFGLANFNCDNAPRFITLNYEAVVLNVPSNQRGTKLKNTIKWTSPDCGTISASAPEITVIEPTLKVTKTANPSLADAGDKVHFTINVMHDPNSDADAYDFQLADSFVNSADMAIIPASVTCSPAGSTTCSASTIQVSAAWPKVALGQTMVVQFDATVNNLIRPCQDPVNQVFTSWTSLPGSPGKISPYNNLSFERTGNTSDPGGVENDYRANIQVPLIMPKPTITKTVVDIGGAPPTVPLNVAIGQTVTYGLEICLPQGTTPLVKVTDQLPPGMQAVSATITSTGGITGIAVNQVLPITTGLGAAQMWNLGTLIAPVTPATGTVCFTIRIVTRVCDGSGLPPNQTKLTNGATVQLIDKNGQTVLCQASTQSDTLTVVEPKLDVKKEFIPAFAKPGDTVTIKITVTNNGTADAFGLTVLDTLGGCLTFTTVNAPLGYIANQAAGTVTITGNAAAAIKPGAGNALMFTIAVRVGQCCSVANTATATATTMPDGVVCERTVAGTGSDNLIVTGKNCPCTPPPPNMASWWAFDETTGTVANDISGTVNNVGFYGAGSAKPTQALAVVKNGLFFDGVNDYVEMGLPTDSEINFLGSCGAGVVAESFTIDAWVQTKQATGVANILDKRSLGGAIGPAPIGYELFLFNGRLGFQLADGKTFGNFIAPNSGLLDVNVADGGWHFVAVVLERCIPASPGQGRLYVDGMQVSTFTLANGATPINGSINNNSKLQIGRTSPALAAPLSPIYSSFGIDELEFFKRALSNAELDNIYKAGSGGKCKTAPCQTPSFGAETLWLAGQAPNALAVGDFTGDGKTDLAVTNQFANKISVLGGVGNGTFSPPVSYSTCAICGGGGLTDLAAGFFNTSDNKLDVAVAKDFGNSAAILRGYGFPIDSTTPVGKRPLAIAVGQFNSGIDSFADLATANFTTDDVTILLGNGAGKILTSNTVSLGAGSGPVAVVVGRFNGDSFDDLAVANQTSGEVVILKGSIGGGFTKLGSISVGVKPSALAAGDFDHNGTLDLAVVNKGSTNVSILLNDGTGVLSQPLAAFTVGNNPGSVAVGDLNCDDRLDLVVTNGFPNNISVFLGDGNGDFGSKTVFNTSSIGPDVALGDFNSDGRLDIAVSNGTEHANKISVLLNTCDCGYRLPAITVQPTSQKVCVDDKASFNAIAIGNQPMTVQWESSTDGGVTWTQISGATNNIYSTGEPGKLFRAVFTNAYGKVTSDPVAVSIDSGCVHICPTCPGGGGSGSNFMRVGAQGGASQLTAQVAEDVSWQFVANRDWVVPTGNTEGMGTGTVDFLIPPNPFGVARTGTILFAGQRYDVMQDAATTTRVVRAVAPTAPAVPGGAIILPIEIIAQGNENSLNFSLGFDARVLSNPQAALGSAAGNAMLFADDSSAGRLGVTLELPPGQALVAGTRQILNVTFAVATNSGVASTSVSFADQPAARIVLDASANVLPANFNAATITLVRAVTSVSAASFKGTTLATEEIVAAFGTGLATSTQVATSLPLPTNLAGTTVQVRDSAGGERLSPLFFVSPNQVNYLVPAGSATGIATVTVTSGDGSVSASLVEIAGVAPGIFTASASGRGVAAANALSFRPDGSSFPQPVSGFDPATNQIIALPIDLGPPTDRVFLVLFGTGVRNRSALSAVTTRIGGVAAPVSYAGPQGSFAGLDQINIEIPHSLAGRGLVDVVLTVDGQAANVVTINIK